MQSMSGWARLWAAVSAALALMLVLVIAMAGVGTDRSAADSAGGGAGEAEAVAVEVTLTEFAIEPAELVVPADVPVTLTITNSGSVPHNYVVDGVASSELVPAGATTTLELEPLAEGEYRTLCTEAGHQPAGMEGTLVAGVGAAATAAGEHAADDPDMTPEEMAAVMEDLRGFPAATEGKGNQPLEPEIDADGTKVFRLTAQDVEWETEPGKSFPAMAFNGQIPGPRIDVDLGDNVRIELTNEMAMPTGMHLHGLIVPNEMDGVPGITQRSIMPGETFDYEFEVRNAGSHMYHSHFDAAVQVPSGLLGAFVVYDPSGEEDVDIEVDQDLVMVLNDGPLGYTLNGKSFPATEPIVAQLGERIRIRYMNEGLVAHPMHLHGMPQLVIADDGWPVPNPYYADNIFIAPGDRVDVIVEATEPGTWAYHCHILTHAEGPEGMFGMVTALIVEP